MPEQAQRWLKRIMWGPGRNAPLDWGTELWKWDVSLYESGAGIRAALIRAGRDEDDDDILFHATHTLVVDTIDAAGGVEQAYLRFKAAVNSVHEVHARWSASDPSIFSAEVIGISDPSVEGAWYALEEMLVWARVLDERLKRRRVNTDYEAWQGLIPALAEGPRRDAIVAARSRLLQDGVREARNLSNLSLHMQSSQAGSKRAVVRSGVVHLPFPDTVTAPVSHRWQLTYDQGRDAVSFADKLMDAVSRFMEDVIAALEGHLPERFKDL